MIREAILANVKKWEECGFTAESINDGECDTFAREIADIVPGAVAIWDFEQSGKTDDEFHYMHCFVRYQGRFYDSETPSGVDHWMNLPIFQKHIACRDALHAQYERHHGPASIGCR